MAGDGNRFARFRQSVFFKVEVLFIAALLLVAACLLVFSRLFFSRAAHRLSERVRAQTEMALRFTLAEKFDEYNRMMYQIVVDDELRGSFKNLYTNTAAPASFEVQHIGSIFDSYMSQDRDVLALSFFTDDGVCAVRDSTRWFVERTLWEPDMQSGAIQALIERAEKERRVFIVPDQRHPQGVSFFHLVLRVWDYFSREPLGTLVATIDTRGLWQLLGSVAAEPYAFDFLMQQDGRLLVHPDYGQTGIMALDIPLDAGTPRLSPLLADAPANQRAWPLAQSAEINVTKLPKFDVYLVSVLDSAMYQDMANSYTGFMALFVAAIVLLVSALCYMMLRSQSKDIRAVIEGIRQMRDGKLDVHIETRTKDEIYDIAQTFNASLQSLNIITRQRDEEMLRFLRESERRRKAEVCSLQAQINSHFLYNTLNVINYAAMEGDAKTTSTMLQSLAGCLHYTLNQNLDLVTVQDEISWLEKYLLLQKERSPALFDYAIEVDDEVRGLPVYKLILQPFVENSIIHGFSGGASGYKLTVRFKKLNAAARLALVVTDDGVGMDEGKLAEIRRLVGNVNDYKQSDGVGIGIENSCFRIGSHYKQDAKIDVDSTPGKGTRICIELPIA